MAMDKKKDKSTRSKIDDGTRSITYDSPLFSHPPQTYDSLEGSSEISERDLLDKLGETFSATRTMSFKRTEQLSKGPSGKTYKVISLDTKYLDEHYAIKKVKIGKRLKERDWREECMLIKREVSILRSLNHPNIVKFVSAFVERQSVYILIDICDESIKSMIKKFTSKDEKEKERLIKKYTLQICKVLQYIHSKNIVHRDIRCDNFGVDNDGIVRLIDFGQAKKIKENRQENILQGVDKIPYWLPPELMRNAIYGFNADCWSVGATVYEMATGEPPFSHMTFVAVYHLVGSGEVQPPELPAEYSQNARDFVQKCFTRNPNNRPSSDELLLHPFLTSL